MIVRCKYSKTGEISFVSHLDLLRIFIRAMRRESLDVNYSQGYHPHPKISFSSALSLGIESNCEIIDIDFVESYETEGLKGRLNRGLPSGIKIYDCIEVEKLGSIPSLITHSLYEFQFNNFPQGMEKAVEDILSSTEILISRRNKKGKENIINIRDRIAKIEMGNHKILALLLNSPDGALKPTELLDIIQMRYNILCECHRIIKLESQFFDGKDFQIV